jgi:hypothetical protein
MGFLRIGESSTKTGIEVRILKSSINPEITRVVSDLWRIEFIIKEVDCQSPVAL